MSAGPLELSLYQLLAFLGGLGGLWLLSVHALRRRGRRSAAGMDEDERDWSVPALDAEGPDHSLFHRWDPRIKIPALFVFILCLSGLVRLDTALMAVVVGLGSILAARLPLGRSLRRVSAMAGFLGMFLVVMPLTVPAKVGDTVVVFQHLSWLPFNVRGLHLAGVIVLKASAIALLVDPLLATAPFSTTIQALARLGLPETIGQMLLLAHRYIYVFQHEAQRMNRGMRARGFRKRFDLDTLRTLGNFLGMLLVRSFERTQRVHDAMLSRGYDGGLPRTIVFRARAVDWLKGALWVLAGIALLAFDRWRLP
ncbi:MAG: cobalt ECF transporter T component CbiQ [Syntrophobacteraceae bacterium]|nr:cobalt ECF transporter T component CbiQ [Syntrophobacteraceae bacterium]